MDDEERPMIRKEVGFSDKHRTHPVTPVLQDGETFLAKLMGSRNVPSNRVSESLDYEPMQNKVFYDRLLAKKDGKKSVIGYTGHTLAKFVVTFLTGILTGFFAVAMTSLTGLIIEYKLQVVELTMDQEGSMGKRLVTAFFWFWLFGSALVSVAVAMVQFWAPASAGAGVTLVMAYLNGNHVPNLLRFSTLITKFVGTVCAVGSGLPMGPEGPMVHIGACVASVITYVECKCIQEGGLLGSCFGRRVKDMNIKDKIKVLDEIVSDSDHREFVSAGVSAGISAAFGAPIGGVLFSMEEACSFWSRKTAWRCFLAAILSTFTIQLLNKSATHGMISFTNLAPMENSDWVSQILFLVINAGVAGLLGAAFNSLRMWLWKARADKNRHLQRIGEVIGLVFLVSLCGFFFGWTAGTCMPVPSDWGEDYGLTFGCPETEDGERQYNDVATLFLSSQHHTIIRLFSVGHDDQLVVQDGGWSPPFTKRGLALFTTVYLILMSIGAGLAIPGGLFMPSIVCGASWGCLWGIILRGALPSWNIQPGLYAIMAGTGALGGVFQSAISLVVLVVEGTRGIDYLFGVILAVVVANWVAHYLHAEGVYESELERIGNVYMLRDEPPHRLHTLTAEAIMATGVFSFRGVEKVSVILETLRSTTHNGFPVFYSDCDSGLNDYDVESVGQRLEGLILRSQLLVLLQRRHFVDVDGKPVGREFDAKYELDLETEMRTFFRRYFTHARYLSATAQPLDALQLDGVSTATGIAEVKTLYLDLRPYMNRSPFTVRKDCSASRAHQAFVNLGLRHLVVVDAQNHVVGVITRKDLDHAAGHGWWRASHVAEPPKNAFMSTLQDRLGLTRIQSVGFLRSLMTTSGGAHTAAAFDAAHGGPISISSIGLGQQGGSGALGDHGSMVSLGSSNGGGDGMMVGVPVDIASSHHELLNSHHHRHTGGSGYNSGNMHGVPLEADELEIPKH
ncbi:MAG: hypothetical protein WDW36_000839 [Sanguina aurantia]